MGGSDGAILIVQRGSCTAVRIAHDIHPKGQCFLTFQDNFALNYLVVSPTPLAYTLACICNKEHWKQKARRSRSLLLAEATPRGSELSHLRVR